MICLRFYSQKEVEPKFGPMIPYLKVSVLILLYQPQSEKKLDTYSVLYYLAVWYGTVNNDSFSRHFCCSFFLSFCKKNMQHNHESNGIIEFYNWIEFRKTTNPTY